MLFGNPVKQAVIRPPGSPAISGNFRVTREEYRKQIRALRLILEGKKARLIREMTEEMDRSTAALVLSPTVMVRVAAPRSSTPPLIWPPSGLLEAE